MDHEPSSGEVAHRGKLVRAVTAKLRTGAAYPLEQLPRRAVVQPPEVHSVVGGVHPRADGDVLREGGDVMEVGLHVVVGGWWGHVVVVGRCTA